MTNEIPMKAVRLRNTGQIQMETRRVMTPAQIEERAKLNTENTATAIHKRAVAGMNGR